MNGQILLNNGHWILTADPDVLRSARAKWSRIDQHSRDIIALPADPLTSYQISFFAAEHELEVSNRFDLDSLTDSYRKQRDRLKGIFRPTYVPTDIALEEPARPYQLVAADWIEAAGSGLLADDIGIGKTVSAICAIVRCGSFPAIVVCLPHLQRHWREAFERFAPQFRVHVIDSGTPYRLPTIKGQLPDVLVCNYEKLAGWQDVLSAFGSFVVWDEVQNLRRFKTQKFAAAQRIARKASHCLGLSASPIHNLGGEIWNILEAIQPGRLGSWRQFARQWCSVDEDNPSNLALDDPEEFGSWLRKHFLMLRRTRRDVGRELGSVNRIVESVDADVSIFEGETSNVDELAREALKNGTLGETSPFQRMTREATGLAKAEAVAEFVSNLIENGEPVVLFGYHHRVYSEWARLLGQYSPAFYTGMQSDRQKQDSIDRFREGRTPLFVISIAAGAGLDGLQFASRTVVIGELAWTEEEINQCIGRVDRDGQKDPVTAYILTSDLGLDPAMLARAHLKGKQSSGILGADPVRAIAESLAGKMRSA